MLFLKRLKFFVTRCGGRMESQCWARSWKPPGLRHNRWSNGWQRIEGCGKGILHGPDLAVCVADPQPTTHCELCCQGCLDDTRTSTMRAFGTRPRRFRVKSLAAQRSCAMESVWHEAFAHGETRIKIGFRCADAVHCMVGRRDSHDGEGTFSF